MVGARRFDLGYDASTYLDHHNCYSFSDDRYAVAARLTYSQVGADPPLVGSPAANLRQQVN